MTWNEAQQIVLEQHRPVYRLGWPTKGYRTVVRHSTFAGGFYIGRYACGNDYEPYEPTTEDMAATDWNAVK
jgi:hypothetical protein